MSESTEYHYARSGFDGFDVEPHSRGYLTAYELAAAVFRADPTLAEVSIREHAPGMVVVKTPVDLSLPARARINARRALGMTIEFHGPREAAEFKKTKRLFIYGTAATVLFVFLSILVGLGRGHG